MCYKQIMIFHHPSATIRFPELLDPGAAFASVTHLGIGAHPDDLEFMALHGILAGYHQEGCGFGGITCTNGGGSVREASLGDDALIARRHAEQEEAARIGRYRFIAQLGYRSAEANDPADPRLTDDLFRLFQRMHPRVVYTHNPADKHPTHIAVLARVIAALRGLPPDQRPRQVLGCEVWRGLDWMPDGDKVSLNVSGNPELAEQLATVFTSQTDGGKRYDRAVRGREAANATFGASHAGDGASAVWLAMDLTPLIMDDRLSIRELVEGHLSRFRHDVMAKLARWKI